MLSLLIVTIEKVSNTMDISSFKEFKNEYLDQLLRDITIDMQLALEEYSSRTNELSDSQIL